MSLDFSQIKAIAIPEGSVKKITDSQGNVLWEKPQQAQWHTIWEGSRDIGAYNGTARGAGTNFAQCANNTGYTPLIRITFSNLTADGGYYKHQKQYWVNKTSTESKPSSPQEMTLNIPESGTYPVLGARVYWSNVGEAYGRILAIRDTSNNRVIFNAGVWKTSAIANYTAGFTLTKIEQYY